VADKLPEGAVVIPSWQVESLGWLTAIAKIIHEKLIGELNIVEAARAAEKRIEKQRLQFLAKTAATVVPSTPVSKPRVQRKNRNRKT